MKNQKKSRRRVKERDRDKEKKELVGAKLDHAKFVLCSLPGGFPHLKIIISVSGWSLCHSSPSALLLLAFFLLFLLFSHFNLQLPFFTSFTCASRISFVVFVVVSHLLEPQTGC